MTGALVVTHGSLGAALIGAVEGFLGPQDDLAFLSNDGLSADALRAELARRFRDRPTGADLVVFTDLRGGSCDAAARAATRSPRVAAVCGVNLPMLLEFCHYRRRLHGAALVERVLTKGRAGIDAHGGEP